MKRTAVSVAVVAFLVLAIVGTVSGVGPFVCAMRALAGAAVLFALVLVVGRLAVSIAARVLLESASRRRQVKE